MFLEKIIERNPKLIDSSFQLHQAGKLLPDTFVLDLDMFRQNALNLLKSAQKSNIRLFFMLKQLGRNPFLAKELLRMGYPGAVAVDFREALTYIQNGIPLCNVGHLVQVPKNLMRAIVAEKPEIITVYSKQKAAEINEAARAIGHVQDIMVKVANLSDTQYSGQESGILLQELSEFVSFCQGLKNVRLSGVTAFPCYLYDSSKKEITPTSNYRTLEKAVEVLYSSGVKLKQINTPSATSVLALKKIGEGVGNTGEPGHGLTGTTPAHAEMDLPECPCVVYLSEISHNFAGKAYCYGGGYYRRSHVKEAIVQNNQGWHKTDVIVPEMSNIDYYFGLTHEERISSPVLMAFRYQIFVTRSRLALVEGIQSNQTSIVGIYDALGRRIADGE